MDSDLYAYASCLAIKADDSETDPETDSDKVPMEVCNEVRTTNLLIDDKDETHPENSQPLGAEGVLPRG